MDKYEIFMMQQKLSTRDAYGHALLEIMEIRSDVIVLDSDLSRSTRTEWVESKYPDRFINIGIAEQNMMGVAAGLSMEGFVPFATTYAIFIARGLDQVRQSIAYNKSNVKIVATHAGMAASHDGGSHQCLEDIAFMRVIPNMTLISPCDYNQAKSAIKFAASHIGPVYIRLQKEETDILIEEDKEFVLGSPDIMSEGEDLIIFCTGTICSDVIKARKILAGSGIKAKVVHLPTIKPMSREVIYDLSKDYSSVFVVEEHSFIGGLFESICHALSEYEGFKIFPIGMKDQFSETGHWHELKNKYHLCADGISSTIKNKLNIN